MYHIRNSGKWMLGIKNVKEKDTDVKCNSHSSSSKSSAANDKNIHVVENINVMPVDISILNLESLLALFAFNELSLTWRPICQYKGCFMEQVSVLLTSVV
jgi:hypothetical protein